MELLVEGLSKLLTHDFLDADGCNVQDFLQVGEIPSGESAERVVREGGVELAREERVLSNPLGNDLGPLRLEDLGVGP